MLETSQAIDAPVIVSVCVMSYNLEDYIGEALDSILMQQVNFKYNIIVSDDCSTDNTRKILQHYSHKYPDQIILLLQKKNLGVVSNFVEALKSCKGKYIALLDGDDYWTDPLKLQKQVDFLESNKEYSMVFNNVEFRNETKKGMIVKDFNPEKNSREYTYDEIVKTWSIPTCSVLAINNMQYRYIEDNLWFPVQDLPFYLSCSSIGKIYYLSDITSTYRKLISGSMNSKTFNSLENNLIFIKYFKTLHNDFSDFLTQKTINHISAHQYISVANKYKNMGSTEDYTKHLHNAMLLDHEIVFKRVIQANNKKIKSLKDRIKLQNKVVFNLKTEVTHTKNSLHTINSKIHKIIHTSVKIAPIKKYKNYKEMLKTYYKIK